MPLSEAFVTPATGHSLQLHYTSGLSCAPIQLWITRPEVVQFAELTPGRRIDIDLLPSLHNRLAHAMARLEASFECVVVDGETRVTRTLQFTLAPAMRSLMEPLLRRRLPREIQNEIRLAKDYLEGHHAR